MGSAAIKHRFAHISPSSRRDLDLFTRKFQLFDSLSGETTGILSLSKIEKSWATDPFKAGLLRSGSNAARFVVPTTCELALIGVNPRNKHDMGTKLIDEACLPQCLNWT